MTGSALVAPLLDTVLHLSFSRLLNLPCGVWCVGLCGPGTVLKGVPNNLEFLRKLVEDPRFIAGDTTTKFLEDFHFSPHVMEVVLPGRWTGGTAWNPACTAELMA